MEDDFTIINFKVADKYYGYPEPFIKDGSVVILIKNGSTQISKYYEPNEEHPFPSFSHLELNLRKNTELHIQVDQTIKERFPEYFTTEEELVVLCPIDIAINTIWE